MKINVKQITAELNKLSLVTYLKILGYEPVSELENETRFEVYLHQPIPSALTIDHNTNRFFDKKTGQEGTLMDLACYIFEIKPIELIRNIVFYRIDLLMDESTSLVGHRA